MSLKGLLAREDKNKNMEESFPEGQVFKAQHRFYKPDRGKSKVRCGSLSQGPRGNRPNGVRESGIFWKNIVSPVCEAVNLRYMLLVDPMVWEMLEACIIKKICLSGVDLAQEKGKYV